MPTSDLILVHRFDDGALWDVEIGGSRGNILDTRLVEALTKLFEEAAESRELKAVCLRGQGRHFSFGASVPEHLPDEVGKMLPRFHELFRVMLRSSVVCLAAVRGQCLGGGLELVSFCHRVFASPDAKLGQPEIALGVFAPVASILLSERVGRGHAEDLCLSGRVVDATEALRMGLVDVVDDEPEKAAIEYAKEQILPHSASSLRYATQAARYPLRKRLFEELPAVERLYLEELMATEDAVEGIQAFLDKRPPQWSDA